MRRLVPLVFMVFAAPTVAGPYIPAGDTALRHDIQRLADYGIITGPVTTWPLAWGPLLADLSNVDLMDVAPGIADAVARVRRRADWDTRAGEVTFRAELGLADNAARIRSFQDTPRGRGEASVGLNWIGEIAGADLNVQIVDSMTDDEEVRFDESLVGAVFGNWSVAASTQSRWWGPGWGGSLILSNNARPFPSLTIDRVFPNSPESKWLSWLGPWDLTFMFGLLEEEREVPNARFFGMRFNFRPIPSLEIGLSRGAQLCGEGRPCDSRTFFDMLVGRDNLQTRGIGSAEPGNQLAGIDFRWTRAVLDRSIGVYGQFIGEDEAGGLPSRYIGQIGMEWSANIFDNLSARIFAEYVNTIAEFYASEKRYNYAYNHGIYRTGYRYRGRAIGHGADNDSKLTSFGIVLANSTETQWRALVRIGTLNDGGRPDSRNSLTPTTQDIASVDIEYSRPFRFGIIEAGVGYETIEDLVSGESDGTSRLFLQWRSSY